MVLQHNRSHNPKPWIKHIGRLIKYGNAPEKFKENNENENVHIQLFNFLLVTVQVVVLKD